jgi:hypothetical protein
VACRPLSRLHRSLPPLLPAPNAQRHWSRRGHSVRTRERDLPWNKALFHGVRSAESARSFGESAADGQLRGVPSSLSGVDAGRQSSKQSSPCYGIRVIPANRALP